MKKYTEYQTLTPLEVAEIGEREGWPVEGLVASDDKIQWTEQILIDGILFGKELSKFRALGLYYKYCARPVKRIEWEAGDLVQVNGVKGYIYTMEILGKSSFDTILVNPNTGKSHSVESSELKPWEPGYGHTEHGQLIKPPEGYKIVPEGEPLSHTGKLFQHGAWHEYKLDGNERNNIAQLKFDVRAYARKIEPETQTAVEWFCRSLPYAVADKAIDNTPHDKLAGRHESAASALIQSFNWDEAPEDGDYWYIWHMWLYGDLEERPPIEPENDTAKMGQVWLSPPDHEGDCRTVIVGTSTEPQWDLKLCKCSYFPTETIRRKNGWKKLADSLQDYYAAFNERKSQSLDKIITLAHKHGWNGVENSKILEVFLEDLIEQKTKLITPEMIEKVLRTLPDCYGVTTQSPKGWDFHCCKRHRKDQLKDFAAALNDQLRRKGEEPKSENLRKLCKKWESELKRHKGKAKVYEKRSPDIANMWQDTADIIEDMLGELNDVLNEDIEQQKGR